MSRPAQAESGPSPWPERLSGLVLAAILLGYVQLFARPMPLADDAFISFRYAANLLAGRGYVFNPGEHVEGITNFFWTMLLAALARMGMDLPNAARALSLVFGVAFLWLSYLYAARLLPAPRRYLALIAPAVLFAANGVVYWGMSGLETPLVLTLTVACLLAHDAGRPMLTALLCALAFWTRPDGAILAAALLLPAALGAVHAAACRWWSGGAGVTALLRTHLSDCAPALLFAAAAALLTGFRLIYFGDPLPNTFYAKVGGVPWQDGVLYVLAFLGDGMGPLALAGAIGMARVVPRGRRLGPALFAVLTLVYVLLIGGDVFQHGRFLLPVLPVLIAGNAALIAACLPQRPGRALLAFAPVPYAVLFSLYGMVPLPGLGLDLGFFPPSAVSFPYSAKRARATAHLTFDVDDAPVIRIVDRLRRLSDHPIVAAIGIGRLGYFGLDLHIIDLVGLTDKTIARASYRGDPAKVLILPGHQRSDASYVLGLRPDAILIPPQSRNVIPLPAVVELWASPGLAQNYVFDPVNACFVRRDLPRGRALASGGH